MEFYGPLPNKTGYYMYGIILRETTFSYHYPLKQLSHPPQQPTNLLEGRTLFMDPPWEFLNHKGHNSEITYKLPELRKIFPGKINYLGAAHKNYMHKWSEEQFKLSFPETNWKVPPYFHLEKVDKDTPLCFQELLVPSHTKFGFFSHNAANTYRNNALAMCKVPPRKQF